MAVTMTLAAPKPIVWANIVGAKAERWVREERYRAVVEELEHTERLLVEAERREAALRVEVARLRDLADPLPF